MIEIQWNPTDRQLRQFGFVALVGLPLAGWALAGWPAPSSWSAGYRQVLIGLAAVGLVLAVVGWIRPRMLRLVFLAASLLAWPIGLVLSQVILAIIYFGVFTPVALWFRMIGRDSLQRRYDPQSPSYWQPKAQPRSVQGYYRQS